MSWFDKKRWQLRRKVKDLQADLKEAERDGKYIVEQGLFFAELEDMGEMTMMVFGTNNTMASGDDSVIRTFFDRNGFSVETLKLDKEQTGLADVEILPSEEMTRHVGRLVKNEGYRIIDDSDTERSADLGQKIIPLSALMRAMVLLFADHVQQVISTSRVKMNKEGNRLLRWMPKISESLATKVKSDVIEVIRPSFYEAYEVYYGRVGKLAEVSPGGIDGKSPAAPTSPSAERIPALSFPAAKSGPGSATTATATTPIAPTATAAKSAAPAGGLFGQSAPAPTKTIPAWMNAPTPAPRGQASAPALAEAIRAQGAAETISRMYRSLIGASSSRCVRNSEVLLDEVKRLYNATAACLMVKVPQGTGYSIHSNAGKRLSWGEGGGEGFPVSSTVLTKCLQQRTAVCTDASGGDPSASMIMHKIESAAAAPIIVKDEVVGILYVDRRENPVPFDELDCESLSRVSDVFREFPDLVLGHVG